MYRMQVFGPDLTGMHWHLHKGSAHHFNKYRKAGRRMPVSVTLGGDPVYTYAATAPLPENLDEYLLAGFLRKRRVELVKCLTNDIEVPSDADFVIEGYVDPQEELLLEGPFGDHTGFYSLADYFPGFHVTCITHRRNAVYPATIVGIPPQEDGWIGKATERIFLMPIRMTVAPEVVDMHMPVEGVFHNITLVSISKEYPGQAEKVMTALWGAGQMMFNKVMAVFDAGVNLSDYRELARIVSRNVDPVNDIQFIKGPVDILDHSSRAYASGSKMGIDATAKDRLNTISFDQQNPVETDAGGIGKYLPEIIWTNDTLLNEGISVVIFGIRKDRKDHCRNIAGRLVEMKLIRNIRFVIFTDSLLAPEHLPDIVWITANNIDPQRDCFYQSEEGTPAPVLFVDATRKTVELDGFRRDWPNVITMDDETIRNIDLKWEKLIPGPFLESPTTKYKRLVINDGPVTRGSFQAD
jgi:4-hydroxy-3-polyprenylbenzoate decarboxylase